MGNFGLTHGPHAQRDPHSLHRPKPYHPDRTPPASAIVGSVFGLPSHARFQLWYYVIERANETWSRILIRVCERDETTASVC
jgi:hypothetical protein